MSNICTNQLIISSESFKKIAHLFTQPNESYEKPYLDFAQISPIPDGSTARETWGVSSRPYNTSISPSELNGGSIIIEFQTHFIAPLPVIEALVRQYKIEAELYSYEPGCMYTSIALYTFEDDFNETLDDVSDFLCIEYDTSDIDETCLKIFGITHDEYVA